MTSPYDTKGGAVRLLYLLVTFIVWILSLGGRLFWGRRVILCFHGISDSHRSNFSSQIETITRQIRKVGDAASHSSFWAKPTVVLTFDDALANLIDNVLPIVNSLQVPITIFVTTGSIGGRPEWLVDSDHPDRNEAVMSREQLKNLAENPLITWGIHTHRHPRLSRLGAEQATEEIVRSREILEGLLKRPVKLLAFPHGDYDRKVCDIAFACRMESLFTLDTRMTSGRQTSGVFGRFSVTPDMWPLEFRLTVDGAYSWLYPFRKFLAVFR